MTIENDQAASAADVFEIAFGRAPAGVWSAPGRVNVIGEHTDYNDGLVLPFAIDRRTWCALGPRDDRTLRATSTLTSDTAEISLDHLTPDRLRGWSAYVFGVVWALGEFGVDLRSRSGVDMVLTSDVPLGAGLSSSAALECVVALALNDWWQLGFSRERLALVCQLAENKAVGAPTGIMDQSASLLGRDGHAVLIDCETTTSEIIPLRFQEQDITVMVIDTRVSHAHATGGYGARRRSCELGAAAFNVPSLRALTVADLPEAQRILDEETFRRVRHVVTENDRVAATAAALREQGPLAIGPLLLASHASMRDDFDISVPELDLAVETAMAHGAIGARMTGGGFGGSAIALVPTATFDSIETAVLTAFQSAGFATPHVFSVVPSDGARREL